VFARPLENAVRLDGVPAGEREPVTPGYPEPDLREPQMAWIHGLAGERLRRSGQFRETGLPQCPQPGRKP
jgi:hypothetical protein